MVQCLLFTLYFTVWIALGKNLPIWLEILNVVCMTISVLVAMMLWEFHKSKVEKLEEEIERIKEVQQREDK